MHQTVTLHQSQTVSGAVFCVMVSKLQWRTCPQPGERGVTGARCRHLWDIQTHEELLAQYTCIELVLCIMHMFQIMGNLMCDAEIRADQGVPEVLLFTCSSCHARQNPRSNQIIPPSLKALVGPLLSTRTCIAPGSSRTITQTE